MYLISIQHNLTYFYRRVSKSSLKDRVQVIGEARILLKLYKDNKIGLFLCHSHNGLRLKLRFRWGWYWGYVQGWIQIFFVGGPLEKIGKILKNLEKNGQNLEKIGKNLLKIEKNGQNFVRCGPPPPKSIPVQGPKP